MVTLSAAVAAKGAARAPATASAINFLFMGFSPLKNRCSK
ncbi:MAG: hypothetical protein KatS3mg123_1525 [Burkholderiales bacterium]|nr:MAG: hypothetical protein KatS3mg123_1525 [Burkholderiales bacterium]